MCSDLGMDAKPDSPAAVMDLLIERDLLGAVAAAADRKLTPSHARTMKARNTIPQHWHHPIVVVARAQNLPIDYELLATLAAKTSAAPAQAGEG